MSRGSIEQQLAGLPSLSRSELLAHYAQDWKQAPFGTWSDEQLRIAIGYRLQERLIARMRMKAMDAIYASEVIVSSLSRDSRHRELVRHWKGKVVTVTLLGDQAIYDGKTYRSLAAAGEAITGSRKAGDQLFGLKSSSGGQHAKDRR